ncbi:MAG: phage antirepressor KilAC domain-containing protein [Oceanisphaera sp.]|uniref:phage antirepressor KilAC domain-containing protein n=1 Tax=Oceanisphaera sp. TaxID=1929979 RepID=UPI003C729032
MSELVSVMGQPGELTMSSLELVEFINAERKWASVQAGYQSYTHLRHADFLEKVPLVLGGDERNFPSIYFDSMNREKKCYKFPKREACLMAMSYSYDIQAKVFDRMTRLENEKAGTDQLPTSFAEALRLAAEQAERIEEQQAKLALAAPKVEFVDRYVEASGLQNISTVAKMLHYGPIKFSRLLEADGILYRSGGALVPKQSHIDAGRFALRTGEANGHSWMQTKVTATGVDWLAQRYATEVMGA